MITEWLYLGSGMALLSVTARGKRIAKSSSIFLFHLQLVAGLLILLGVDWVFNFYLWEPIGRPELRFSFILLWAMLLDGLRERMTKFEKEKMATPLAVSRFLLALTAFAVWTIEKERALSIKECLLWGLSLPAAAGLFEYFLEGLRERLGLADIPKALEGIPILFLTVSIFLLALSFVI